MNSEDSYIRNLCSTSTNILLLIYPHKKAKYSQAKTMHTERAVLSSLSLMLAGGVAVEPGDSQ